jgi:hypothetical protein
VNKPVKNIAACQEMFLTNRLKSLLRQESDTWTSAYEG